MKAVTLREVLGERAPGVLGRELAAVVEPVVRDGGGEPAGGEAADAIDRVVNFEIGADPVATDIGGG